MTSRSSARSSRRRRRGLRSGRRRDRRGPRRPRPCAASPRAACRVACRPRPTRAPARRPPASRRSHDVVGGLRPPRAHAARPPPSAKDALVPQHGCPRFSVATKLAIGRSEVTGGAVPGRERANRLEVRGQPRASDSGAPRRCPVHAADRCRDDRRAFPQPSGTSTAAWNEPSSCDYRALGHVAAPSMPRPPGCDVDWVQAELSLRRRVTVGSCRGDVGPTCLREPCPAGSRLRALDHRRPLPPAPHARRRPRCEDERTACGNSIAREGYIFR